MLANTNKTNTRFGQVIEYMMTLEQSDVTADLKQQYFVFKNTTSGQNIVRIKQTDDQLYYNVFIEGEWDATDIPLTLSDPDQLRNLPIEPHRINNNTYARMDTTFHLYKEGAEYIRIEQGTPNKIFYTTSIGFQRQGDANAKLTIDTSVTTSAQRLDMNTQRISSLADPTSATDAVNRQFLDKYDMPIGALMMFWGYNSPDSSWLECSGGNFNQATYPDLYAFLGNSNTLPNLQGAFLRGWSGGITPTLDSTNPRAVRTYQADDNKSHTHTVNYVDTYASENLGTNLGYLGHSDPDYDNQLLTINRQATSESSGGPQSQPRNYAVLILIKARRSRDI